MRGVTNTYFRKKQRFLEKGYPSNYGRLTVPVPTQIKKMTDVWKNQQGLVPISFDFRQNQLL
jgi:hypothetical protein